MLEKFRKNNKKGFTLVEMIVVLVILAILAALLIPALTGYIDKAKEKQIVAETRQIVMAAQTLVDEEYAKNDAGDGTGIKFLVNYSVTPAPAGEILIADVGSLAELELVLANGAANVQNNKDVYIEIGTTNPNAGKITSVVYKNHNLKCTYTADTKDYKVD